jgi:hypothetical protein
MFKNVPLLIWLITIFLIKNNFVLFSVIYNNLTYWKQVR